MLFLKRLMNMFRKEKIIYVKPKKYMIKVVGSNLTNVYEYNSTFTRKVNYADYYYDNYELINDKFVKSVLCMVHSPHKYIIDHHEIRYVDDVIELYEILDGHKVLEPWLMSRIIT